MKYFISILTGLIFSLSCEQDSTNTVLDEQGLYDDLIIKSSNRVVIDGIELELQATLWRDFMPGQNPGGNGLMSINRLISTDSTAIPGHIVLSAQYVMSESSVWEAVYSEEIFDTPDFVIERIARNGPDWETGIPVTIVAEVKSLKDDTTYYVRLEEQKIYRTD